MSVTDNGTGPAPERQRRIFDPFFTAKGPHEGAGRGLSVGHSIAAVHGRWIEGRSRFGEQTTMRVELPFDAPVAERDRTEVAPPLL